jgi:hypothetical protein
VITRFDFSVPDQMKAHKTALIGNPRLDQSSLLYLEQLPY